MSQMACLDLLLSYFVNFLLLNSIDKQSRSHVKDIEENRASLPIT